MRDFPLFYTFQAFIKIIERLARSLLERYPSVRTTQVKTPSQNEVALARLRSHSLRSLVKSLAPLTDEAKPPLQLVSLIHFFISEAASFLHRPQRVGFIAKAVDFRQRLLLAELRSTYSNLRPHPNRSPAKRVRFGKGGRSQRIWSFRGAYANRGNGMQLTSSDVVEAGGADLRCSAGWAAALACPRHAIHSRSRSTPFCLI